MKKPKSVKFVAYQKCDECDDNLGYVYDYRCKLLYCKACWAKHTHPNGKYVYYCRRSLTRKEKCPKE